MKFLNFNSLLALTALSFGIMASSTSHAIQQKVVSGPGCMSEERGRELLRQFSVKEYMMVFKTVFPSQTVELCSDKDDTAKVLKLIDFIDKIPTMSAGQESMQSSSMSETPGEFLRKRIKEIHVEMECEPGKVAFVRSTENQIMHICPALFDHTPEYASSFIMHEARHVDGFDHVACKRGHWQSFNERTGMDACDESYEDQGSYGIGLRYLLNVAKTDTIAPATAQSARSWAAVEAISRFNRVPLDITRGGVFLGQSGSLTFSDGHKNIEIGQASPSSMLVRAEPANNQDFYLFDHNDKNVHYYDVFLNKTVLDDEHPFTSTFRTKTGAGFLDVAHPIMTLQLPFTCYLTEKNLICSAPRKKPVTLAIKNFKPVGFVITSASYLLKSETFYIASTDGDLYEIPSDFNDIAKMKDTRKFAKANTRYGMASMIGWKNGGDLGVRLDGTVWAFDPTTRAWNQISIGSPSEKYKKVIGPYYWSPRLKDL